MGLIFVGKLAHKINLQRKFLRLRYLWNSVLLFSLLPFSKCSDVWFLVVYLHFFFLLCCRHRDFSCTGQQLPCCLWCRLLLSRFRSSESGWTCLNSSSILLAALLASLSKSKRVSSVHFVNKRPDASLCMLLFLLCADYATTVAMSEIKQKRKMALKRHQKLLNDRSIKLYDKPPHKR